jgi:hypothetical protein
MSARLLRRSADRDLDDSSLGGETTGEVVLRRSGRRQKRGQGKKRENQEDEVRPFLHGSSNLDGWSWR